MLLLTCNYSGHSTTCAGYQNERVAQRRGERYLLGPSFVRFLDLLRKDRQKEGGSRTSVLLVGMGRMQRIEFRISIRLFHTIVNVSPRRQKLELALAPVCGIGAVIGLVQVGHRGPSVLASNHLLDAVT